MYDFFVISLILTQNIRLGVIIIQPINDFRDKYMVPINSESFKTPSLTSHTLPNIKLSICFCSKISIRYHNFEHFSDNQKQEFNLNFLINPSIPLYKHTSHEIVC